MPRLVSCLRCMATAADAAAAAAELQQLLGIPKETEEQLHARLSLLVKQQPVMLFMKGKRDAPFCRFSKAVLQLLQQQGVKQFGTFDVFDDEAVREGLKKFSDWPTYPQLYVNGELVGGLDVLKAMVEDGSFKGALPASAFEDAQ
ncbi:PKC-interacting cousin of thioredoxin, putative [Eimeria acervulina]|uniref:PKC-interacting cousin of thioredoxin, putative n=1 Tax=Eimeria acervulina TaxID=5801 RepID=U6GEQ6_EIMAC|nr:PKC-interacting cousin of thioredoxin, putative [Eimeria acervulina]CDI77838.1 PKC-interacting cousin of thioredoxin, putative [Eimeria acervulina]